MTENLGGIEPFTKKNIPLDLLSFTLLHELVFFAAAALASPLFCSAAITKTEIIVKRCIVADYCMRCMLRLYCRTVHAGDGHAGRVRVGMSHSSWIKELGKKNVWMFNLSAEKLLQF